MLERGETVSARYRFRRLHRSWAWVEEKSVAVADGDGRPVWRQGVMRDVTALRRAEERSREVSAALIAAVEREQARIATELHDDTVQLPTALHL